MLKSIMLYRSDFNSNHFEDTLLSCLNIPESKRKDIEGVTLYVEYFETEEE